MKNHYKTSFIRLLFYIIILILAFVSKVDRTNYREGTVEKCEDGTVSIIDKAGEVWLWGVEEGEAFAEGQHVVLVMDDNNTKDTIEDDIILKIKLDN